MKLQIEKMVYGGAGLAHPNDGEGMARTLLVPFTLPEELIEARLTEQKGEFGEASLLKILTASQARIPPGCQHFGECGGCHYQHALYPAQVDIKTAILQQTLHYQHYKLTSASNGRTETERGYE